MPSCRAAAREAVCSGEQAPAPAAEATPPPQPSPSEPHQGTILGAVALITGSTVGAGMLALPAVSAPAGIVPTSAGLVAIWALLTLDALLIAEVNTAALRARSSGSANGDVGADSGIVSLRQMAEFTLGKAGKGLTLIYLALAYSLLTAYCTKAAEVLDFFAGGGLPPLLGASLFCGAVGGLLYKEGTGTIDTLNQGLTTLLLALFAVILAVGAGQSALPAALVGGAGGLAALGPCDWSALQPAVPIMFLALVYHDLIPVIVTYLGGDRRAIRTAILAGSLVPLTMFLSWEAVALSLLPPGLSDPAGSAAVLQASLQPAASAVAAVPAVLDASLAGGAAALASGASEALLAVGAAMDDAPAALPLALDPLDVFVRRSGPVAGSVVQGFSFLAVLTSFTGTTLSLSETLRTEVPSLLREAAKLAQRTAGAELASDFSNDDAAVRERADAPGSPGDGSSLGAGNAGAGGLGGDPRAVALLLTLCPPIALASANPDAFLGALEIAGGYFMTLLYGILPPVMAWRLRAQAPGAAAAADLPKSGSQAPQHGQRRRPGRAAQAHVALPWPRQQHEEMVPGGAPVLAGMFSAACAIGLSRLAADAGLTGGQGAAAAQAAVEVALRTPGAAGEALLALVQAAPL